MVDHGEERCSISNINRYINIINIINIGNKNITVTVD